MDRTWVGTAVVLGFALAASHVAAQKMYRCGNTFQDRPCTAAPPAQPAATATTAPAAAAPAVPAADARPATGKHVQQSASAREAQRRQDLCESLNLQLEDVRARQRAGGPAGEMESLGKHRREIEEKLSASRC